MAQFYRGEPRGAAGTAGFLPTAGSSRPVQHQGQGWSFPDCGGGSQRSVPMSPLALSLSRGDQCLTNNSTYFEITADNTTLVKHGE